MATCEFVGGPRDGEMFTVPGFPPPWQITVLDRPGTMRVWHPVEGDVPVVVCHLQKVADIPSSGTVWRYLWPRTG